MNRREIIELLRGNVVNVTFIKVGGERRVMRCTLRADLVPASETQTKVTEHAEREDQVAVYDLDKKGWRTFKVDRVEHIEYD